MAISKARADICLLCDDDETIVPGYEDAILKTYEAHKQADVIIFKMVNRPPSFADKAMGLRFFQTIQTIVLEGTGIFPGPISV